MEFENLSITERNNISKDIEYNVAQEAMARDYYYTLLNQVAREHQEVIKGIIEDEINHSIILMKLAEIYSQNTPSEFENIMKLKRKE